MNLKKILFLLLLLQFAFSLSLKYFSFLGDQSTDATEIVLKYFSLEDIKKGTDYGQRGFPVSIASKVLDFLFIGILPFTLLGFSWEAFLQTKWKAQYYLLVMGFIGSIFFLRFSISLPFSYYFGFVLEHRFGFSNMLITD